MRLFTLGVFFCIFAVFANNFYAQSPQRQRTVEISATPTPTPTPDDNEIIKVNTQFVSIPVRVLDKKNRFIGGLVKGDFKVLEDGVEQDVSLFSNEQEPFTVALLLDMSYSATFKVADIQAAAIEFIDQLRPQDRVMVISFDEDVHVLCEATGDRQQIYKAIKSTKIRTGTSIYDAVDLVINDRLRPIEGRKAVILFTDGVDTTSRKATDQNNLGDAMELDALVYPIRYDTYADVQKMKNKSGTPPAQSGANGETTEVNYPSTKGTTAEEYKYAEEYLTNMADRTGGRIYLASTLSNLSDSFSKIASELREFYSLGYYPKQDRLVGKTTNIKVRVDKPGAIVRAREGFIVPKKAKPGGQ